MLSICPNRREPAGLPIVMQIFWGGKLKSESVERVFLYIYVNIGDRSAPVYAKFFCLSIFFFGRVRYCITFIVAVSTLVFVRKLIR